MCGSHFLTVRKTNRAATAELQRHQNHDGAQVRHGPISIPPWMISTRNFTEEANTHNDRNTLAE